MTEETKKDREFQKNYKHFFEAYKNQSEGQKCSRCRNSSEKYLFFEICSRCYQAIVLYGSETQKEEFEKIKLDFAISNLLPHYVKFAEKFWEFAFRRNLAGFPEEVIYTKAIIKTEAEND